MRPSDDADDRHRATRFDDPSVVLAHGTDAPDPDDPAEPRDLPDRMRALIDARISRRGLIGGALGVLVGWASGMSVGGAAVLGTMAASASYIAAPAAVRIAIPDANPSLYLTTTLGITFPFNILFGIPLYYSFAGMLY